MCLPTTLPWRPLLPPASLHLLHPSRQLGQRLKRLLVGGDRQRRQPRLLLDLGDDLGKLHQTPPISRLKPREPLRVSHASNSAAVIWATSSGVRGPEWAPPPRLESENSASLLRPPRYGTNSLPPSPLPPRQPHFLAMS